MKFNMRKRLLRDLNAHINWMRSERSRIERDFEHFATMFPPSARQVRKAARTATRLIEDVEWLRQQMLWLMDRNLDIRDPNSCSFLERANITMTISLIKELQAPIAEYFEVIPSEAERDEAKRDGVTFYDDAEKAREWMEKPLRGVLEMGRRLSQHAAESLNTHRRE